MYVQVSVEIEKHDDNNYEVYLSHNGSSGCLYDGKSLNEIGDCVKDYINNLDDNDFSLTEDDEGECYGI
jgi:hypothetical protein